MMNAPLIAASLMPPSEDFLVGLQVFGFFLLILWFSATIANEIPLPHKVWMLWCPVTFNEKPVPGMRPSEFGDVAVLTSPRGTRVPVFREVYWYDANTGKTLPSVLDARLDRLRRVHEQNKDTGVKAAYARIFAKAKD